MAARAAASLHLAAARRPQNGLQAKPSSLVTPSRCTSGKVRLQVSCRYGGATPPGGGRGGGGMRMPGSGIIIPGTGRQGGNDGMSGIDGIDTPGFQPGSGPMMPPIKPEDGSQFYQPFKAPTEAVQEPEGIKTDLSVDQQIQIVRERRGMWFELARYIANLQRVGVTSELIDMECSITPREQNVWAVASNVYFSLVEMPDFPEEARVYYGAGQGQLVLYELRVLSQSDRLLASTYCAAAASSAAEAVELVKAMKDYKKRQNAALMEGFSGSCGDMLALKFYREAMELKVKEERERHAEKGIAVATSKDAKMSLQRLISVADEELEGDTAFATLSIVSLNDEEQSFWPVAVLGKLSEVSSSSFNNQPMTNPAGLFKVFKPQGGAKYTALPLFGPLATADDPVALLVSDTTEIAIPSLAARRGQCLLVVDREHRAPTSDAFFLTFKKSSSGLIGLEGAGGMERASVMAG
eukprot:CAMPEP_0118926848 /NCGR_PEP_ID=MMETSP1169-20130426/4456_1 /TAXON_ID=36882 /ORGANISM="Pyramimonas obovata, Strain CCMP722" /LENGTH=466 /DNA_ID=CAMNT_0006868487 /DNA_START=56 /DNA_END=1453 /DNA_ORIENTATION=-